MYVSSVTYSVQCTYRACRMPICPSKCTYRSLSADPPTNKHWDIQLVWYACNDPSLLLALRFYISCLTGKAFSREINTEICKVYSNRSCFRRFNLFSIRSETVQKLLAVCTRELKKNINNFYYRIKLSRWNVRFKSSHCQYCSVFMFYQLLQIMCSVVLRDCRCCIILRDFL